MAKIVGLVVFFLALYFRAVVSNRSGAPVGQCTCEDLVPDNTSPHIFTPGNGGYMVTTNAIRSASVGYFSYAAGMEYTVTISANANDAEGFLIQAWDPSDARIGFFSPTDGNKVLDCSSYMSIPADATLTHSEVNVNKTIVFSWTAPTEGDGMVDFRYTIVAREEGYYGPLSASSPDGLIPTMAPTAGSVMVSMSFFLSIFVAAIAGFIKL